MSAEAPHRVDSSTPEGRLWNWLAGEWERTCQANNRQAERLKKIRELHAPEYTCDCNDTEHDEWCEPDHCRECGERSPWPCKTVALLNERTK